MAERRMFAKTIVDSDAFLEMPMSARLLYYDLAMRADDDGFINSPKKIMRFIGATNDDMNILIMRKFIIPFDNGIVVIKHWRIHNYIRKDTYNETSYKEQKAMLELDENKAYRLSENNSVDGSLTQVSIGKVSIDKDNSLKKTKAKESPAENEFDFNAEKAWNDTFAIYPKKSASATAKMIWMNKLLDVIPENQYDVAVLIAKAVKSYLTDYENSNPNDTKYQYIPKFDKWLTEDCDYWISVVEKGE